MDELDLKALGLLPFFGIECEGRVTMDAQTLQYLKAKGAWGPRLTNLIRKEGPCKRQSRRSNMCQGARKSS